MSITHHCLGSQDVTKNGAAESNYWRLTTVKHLRRAGQKSQMTHNILLSLKVAKERNWSQKTGEVLVLMHFSSFFSNSFLKTWETGQRWGHFPQHRHFYEAPRAPSPEESWDICLTNRGSEERLMFVHITRKYIKIPQNQCSLLLCEYKSMPNCGDFQHFRTCWYLSISKGHVHATFKRTIWKTISIGKSSTNGGFLRALLACQRATPYIAYCDHPPIASSHVEAWPVCRQCSLATEANDLGSTCSWCVSTSIMHSKKIASRYKI